MPVEDWIKEIEGKNKKYKRETLLNYAMNRWGLNKASSVGPTSDLIRTCAPSNFEEWQEFYFKNAKQKKKNGLKITKDYIISLGQTLYVKLSEVVQNELESISESECIDYAYNLVLNRTYEGYRSEIETIYGQLETILKQKIEPAPDTWDRKYSIDFFIKINNSYIGLQVKPISSEQSLNQYQWLEINKNNHQKFLKDYGGKVFFIFSIKGQGKKKKIYNTEIIDSIIEEISHIKSNR